MSEKSLVEGRIVGHEDALSDKIPKTRKNLIRLRLACAHLIADAVHAPGRGRYALLRVDQGLKFSDDPAIIDRDSPDLNYPLPSQRGQTGCLDVQGNLQSVRCMTI